MTKFFLTICHYDTQIFSCSLPLSLLIVQCRLQIYILLQSVFIRSFYLHIYHDSIFLFPFLWFFTVFTFAPPSKTHTEINIAKVFLAGECVEDTLLPLSPFYCSFFLNIRGFEPRELWQQVIFNIEPQPRLWTDKAVDIMSKYYYRKYIPEANTWL